MDEYFTCCLCGWSIVVDPDGGSEATIITITTPIQGRGWLNRSGKVCPECARKIDQTLTNLETSKSWD